jgi:hypothetical protein
MREIAPGHEPTDRGAQPDRVAPERPTATIAPTVRVPARGSVRPARPACSLDERAMSPWPRLDRRTLTRCDCDAARIARYVARRTSLPIESITAMLLEP